jgi:hypothetical protein
MPSQIAEGSLTRFATRKCPSTQQISSVRPNAWGALAGTYRVIGHTVSLGVSVGVAVREDGEDGFDRPPLTFASDRNP